MINRTFQLIKPGLFNIKYDNIDFNDNKVIVKISYLSLCHADQRYYLGNRDPEVLKKKLPMALIHEACGIVVYDPTGTFNKNDKVVLIPNRPPKQYEDYYDENYVEGTKFLSSGYDGFMREFISVDKDRIVKYDSIDDEIYAMCEFISVGFQGFNRFINNSIPKKETIAIFGNGSLGFVMANILKYKLPNSKIIVIGKGISKMNAFSFVDNVYLSDEIPSNLKFDHAFECVGGINSEDAINSIIDLIKPQGSIVLMGVSEKFANINTRLILEKGIRLIGTSRSNRNDFENAVNMLKNNKIRDRFKSIVYEDKEIRNINDIHRFFNNDLNTPFKTVAKWNI